MVNAIGVTRTYGAGLELRNIEGLTLIDLLFSFRGEIGSLFVLLHIAETPPPELVYFAPWTVAAARLIPTFLWPNKPYPEYLLSYSAGFPDSNATQSGVVGPHQAELLLQFGWYGLPLLAFINFIIACHTIHRLQLLGREARIADCAVVPAFFGFYMQQRGYFFQLLCEYLFTFGPLFLLHVGDRYTRPFFRP